MREVDHIHDAEDQRQPGREQKQHHAELQAVDKLDGEKGTVQAKSLGCQRGKRTGRHDAPGQCGRNSVVRRHLAVAAVRVG